MERFHVDLQDLQCLPYHQRGWDPQTPPVVTSWVEWLWGTDNSHPEEIPQETAVATLRSVVMGMTALGRFVCVSLLSWRIVLCHHVKNHMPSLSVFWYSICFITSSTDLLVSRTFLPVLFCDFGKKLCIFTCKYVWYNHEFPADFFHLLFSFYIILGIWTVTFCVFNFIRVWLAIIHESHTNHWLVFHRLVIKTLFWPLYLFWCGLQCFYNDNFGLHKLIHPLCVCQTWHVWTTLLRLTMY